MTVDKLQSLLQTVAEQSSQHLNEVEADLQQTADLLSVAINKLGASFMVIHEAAVMQQQALDAAMAGMDAVQKKEMLACRGRIDAEVDAVITGLQFQDMTSQLLARAQKRVDGLREVLAALAQHQEDELAAHEPIAVARLLEDIGHSLHARSSALQDGMRKEVSQKHMDSGEIELF